MADVTTSERFAGLMATDAVRSDVPAHLARVAELAPHVSREARAVRSRLLVPVDVQALVATDDSPYVDVAVTTLDRMAAADGVPVDGERTSAPFADPRQREAGVHLHWVMPDGLTRGHVDGDVLQLQPLPDRWLVVRIELARTPHPVRAWVLESDRGLATPLEQWPRDPADVPDTASVPPAELTAMTGGDTAWASVYDNVANRFGFHDQLSDRRVRGRLSYLVVGWYGTPSLDPLAGVGLDNVTRVLGELGWSAPGLAARIRSWRSKQPGGRTAEEVNGEGSHHATERVRRAFGDKGVQAGAADLPVWCPRETVYHGRVEGVDPSGGGADRRPGARSLSAAIGPTAAESAAALHTSSDAAEDRETAFAYDLLEEVGAVDGMVTLDEERHRRAFVGRGGGVILETIVDGDRLAPLRGATRPTRKRRSAFGDFGLLDLEVVLGMLRANHVDAEDVLEPNVATALVHDLQLAATTADGRTVGEVAVDTTIAIGTVGITSATTMDGSTPLLRDPRQAERLASLTAALLEPAAVAPRTVRRPAPRWYRPQDPVLTLRGVNRSLRAGYDGRFGADEPVLACRLSNDEVTELSSLLHGRELVGSTLRRTGIPRQAQALLWEAVLVDGTDEAVSGHAEVVVAGGRTVPVGDGTRSGGTRAVTDRLRAEARVERWAGQVEADTGLLLEHSIALGTRPSPVATTWWQQPWVPLYVEWEVAVHHDEVARRLGELDFEDAPALGREPEVLTGRSLLTSAPARSTSQRTRRFLADDEERGGPSSLLRDLEDAGAIADMAQSAEREDVLAAALEGLLDHALGYEGNEAFAPAGEEPDVAPTAVPHLVRSGALVVRRLRVVDAFGRFIDVEDDQLRRLDVATGGRSGLVDEDDRPAMDLSTRIVADTRLWVRFVDRDDPTRDAVLDQATGGRSPVAGWVQADHVDRSLEVFGPDGEPLGQLRHATLGGVVVWDGVPGAERTIGAMPTVEEVGPTLAAFAGGLAARDAAELAGAVASSDDEDTVERESPLSALLRVIDTTLWTVDPFGLAGDEHLTMLTGHAIAIVRARVGLEVHEDTDEHPSLSDAQADARRAAFRELAATPFEVRLGALTRVDDGLLGWFADDDYQTFHPVHPSVLTEAGAVGDDLTIDPVTSPYVTPDATITLYPRQTRWVTLLLSPAGAVHATSGIVPRKAVALPRDWTATALERLAPSFRIGPVLVDPTTVRMPRPTQLGDTTWVHRGTPTTWEDDPLKPSSVDALLPERSPVLQDGWIRIQRTPEDD